MKLEIEIPAELEERVCQDAAALGQQVPDYVQSAFVEFVQRRIPAAQSRMREPGAVIDSPEISAPFDLPYDGEFRKITPRKLPPGSILPDPLLDDE